MNKRARKFTAAVLLHTFGAFLLLQGLPSQAGAAELSNLTPLEDCNDPLGSVAGQVVPDLMIVIDTSGSMEETTENFGLRTGADDPRAKMSILKRALTKLIQENSDKINIGLATYNQQRNTAGSAVTFKYDFDYVYAKNPSVGTGSETLVTTADPTSTPTPANVLIVSPDTLPSDPLYPHRGQYFYDNNGNGTVEPGTDYMLVGSFIPAIGGFGGSPATTAVQLASYNWLWVSTANVIPGVVSNFNLDNFWHVHDTYLGGGDTYLDLSCQGDHSGLGLQFVGTMINNEWFYQVPTSIDSEANDCPGGSRHRVKTVDSVGAESTANAFEAGWHRYVSIDAAGGISTPSNPRLAKVVSLLNPQNIDLTDDGDSGTEIDNPGDMDSDSDSTGLMARGATPLFQSMQYAFEYFARLIDPSSGNRYSSVFGANSTDTGIASVSSDPQSPVLNPNGCRKSFLLIVTDGKSTDNAGFPTYQEAIDDVMGTGVSATTGLTDLGVKVLVVGFSLSADGANQVDYIAQQSDLDGLPSDPSPDTADEITEPFLATNEPTLLSSLQAAFAAVAAGRLNTSAPVLGTNVDVISGHTATERYGNAGDLRVSQNVLVTSYAELPSFKGHVQEFRLFDYTASPTTVVIPSPPTLLWDAGTRTSSRSLVLTSFPSGGSLDRSQFLPSDVIPGGGTGGPFDTVPSDYNNIKTELAAGNNTPSPPMSNADWDVLIRWVRDSYGLETGPTVGAMGSPILASPAVVGPPLQEPAPDSQYVTFAAEWKNRPTMVYQAADDGMIHAIVGGLPSGMAAAAVFNWNDGWGVDDYFGGDELWAYVPLGILNSLVKFDAGQATSYPPPELQRYASGNYLVGQAIEDHKYLINADIVTADVKIDDPTVGGTTLEWKTVIMGGYGPGNEGFWCIDVTDPQDPKQLWDTDDAWSVAERATLGLTYSTPRIGKIRIDVGGVPETKYVAFVGSGYHEGRDAAEDLTSDARGKNFYILDMSTGQILYKYEVDDITGIGGTPNKNKLVGSVATVDEDFNGFVDAAFIGDLEGRVWKFAVDNSVGTILPDSSTSPYISGTTPVPYFFDDDPVLLDGPDLDSNKSMVGNGNSGANTGKQPIVAAPSVTMQYYADGSTSGYAPIAFFGTGGDACVTLAAGEFNFIDGFIDPDQPGEIEPRGKRFCLGATPMLTLSQNEHLVGNPVVLGTKAYITTFKEDTADPCSKGQGLGYIIDFGTCLTAAGYSTGTPALTDLSGTTVAPGSGTPLGEGQPAGIAAGPGGVYMIGEGGTITGIQGGAGADGKGTCAGCINPQLSVGTAGQLWREEER